MCKKIVLATIESENPLLTGELFLERGKIFCETKSGEIFSCGFIEMNNEDAAVGAIIAEYGSSPNYKLKLVSEEDKLREKLNKRIYLATIESENSELTGELFMKNRKILCASKSGEVRDCGIIDVNDEVDAVGAIIAIYGRSPDCKLKLVLNELIICDKCGSKYKGNVRCITCGKKFCPQCEKSYLLFEEGDNQGYCFDCTPNVTLNALKNNDMSSYSNRILVTTGNIEAVKAQISANDQVEKLEVGCQSWKFTYKGKTEQMTIWPNGMGAVQYGDNSDWGDWCEKEKFLYCVSDIPYANSSQIDTGWRYDIEGDSIFICGNCGKAIKSDTNDYPENAGQTKCKFCLSGFCSECSNGLVIDVGGESETSCSNCYPNHFVAAVIIGTADLARMLRPTVSLDENDIISNAFIQNFKTALQSYFENADIRFDQTSQENEILFFDSIDASCHKWMGKWMKEKVVRCLKSQLCKARGEEPQIY